MSRSRRQGRPACSWCTAPGSVDTQALADRLAVLLEGRICQLDETSRVFWALASEEIARFVGLESIVEGRVTTVDMKVAVIDVNGRRVEVGAPASPANACESPPARGRDAARRRRALPSSSMRNHL